MAESDVTRRLAAIVAADVAGYSRLTAADEEGTFARLRDHRKELIDPKISDYRGRIANTAGDSLLIEFPSVVDALRCSVDIQRGMTERNSDVPEERRVEFRVGINLGDVIEEGGDLLGDGVNVAARLEGLAEPGGICLSRAARDQVRDRVDITLEDMGEVKVKNIPRPVRVFRVLGEREEAKATPRPTATKKWLAAAAAVSLLAIVTGGGFWWWRSLPDFEPADPAKMAYALPEKPSIAVLPFENLGDDAEHDYLADGLADNIITALTEVSNLFVIARNSTFTYKGKPVKVQQVAEELGVRYVLEGSVLKSGERVRVNIQLVDALSGHHIWAERYDRDLGDIFALLDDVAQNVVVELEVNLTEGEQARIRRAQTLNLDAFDTYLRGQRLYRRFDKLKNREARQFFEAALAKDPEFTEAWEELALTHYADARFGWSKDRAQSIAEAERLARKAMAIDDSQADTYAILANIVLLKRQYDDAVALCETSLNINANETGAVAGCANAYHYADKHREAADLMRRAMRLSPYYQAWYLGVLGRAELLMGQTEEAIEIFETYRQRVPKWTEPLWFLAAAYAAAGRDAEASATVADALNRKPKTTVSVITKRYPYQEGSAKWFAEALRKAGFPDHLPLPLPDKPSIAVLPFANLSNDPEQAYFADGMAEDIITDLSKLSGLFVIARNSSFQYRGDGIDVKQVHRELGVKYALEGSVRRAGEQVRINAQLIDAQSGGHLWAERYDGSLADVFKLQDRVTAQIVASLSVTLNAGEHALTEQTETSVPEAYDAFLLGWRHFRLRTLEDYRKALSWLRKAVALDPEYSRAWALLASLYHEAWERDWADELGVSVEEIPALLDKALQRPTPLAHQVKAERLMSQGRWDDAEIWLDKASALDPNDPDTFVLRSTLFAIRGDTDTAIALMKTAMRLDPHYPAFNLYRLGAHYLRAGDAGKAIELLERAQGRNTGDWVQLVYLTVAYAEAGRLEDAERAAKTLAERRRELGFLVTLAGSFDNLWDLGDTFRERIHQALLKAGLPSEPTPKELNLSPEHRISGAEMREALKSPYRNKGRRQGGVWMRDMDQEGNGVHYWQGNQTATSTSEIKGHTQYTKRSNGMEQTCTFYRNPEGTKENLDEQIAVCSNGIYPFARFPQPESAR